VLNIKHNGFGSSTAAFLPPPLTATLVGAWCE